MNRRSFLKKLGIGAATVALAPAVLKLGSTVPATGTTTYHTYVMGQNAVIGEYAEYTNFSDMAIAQAIDEHVQYAAEELGKRAGQSIDELYHIELTSR